MTAQPKVLLIATQDTKQTEARYLRDCLEQAGLQVFHLDPSIRPGPEGAEITPADIAAAAGTNMEAIRALNHEGQCQAMMLQGALICAHQLHEREGLSGILAIGGSMGTGLATTVMRSFPIGLPKVMISTMASGMTTPYVGTRDITMVNAICDIAGLNSISRDVYRNGALALAGMAHGYSPTPAEGKPLVLISTLGTTEKCCARVRLALEQKGFEVMVFHTTGAGGQALEAIVSERPVAAVVDMSLVEIIDFLN
ncbi:MAG: Tm-1-like ATP-binding domain-containing protein, partial [Pseudomonadales bacterium]|nr:Tm-1-like ATP-binding domain-containing protein [Pseudomonadales bacterium]